MKLQILLVIFLTLLSGCALLPIDSNPPEDPIVSAVLSERGILPQEKDVGYSTFQLHKELEIQKALESGEVVLGMKMQDVISVWGEPNDIEMAGDPLLKNQKWIYSESPSRQTQLSSARIVYFEEGQVAGWENAP